MANKRNLKKAIRYACGDMAGQCIIAESVLQGADIEKWDNVILNIAMLQEEAINDYMKTEAGKVAAEMNALTPKK